MTENVLAFPQEECAMFPVITTDTGDQFVDARALHAALEVGRDFATWIKDRIEKYGFFNGIDFSTATGLSSPVSGSAKARAQETIDYRLSLSMAKELAMVENNDRGREVRQYLIKVEEAWNTPELVIARALQKANVMIQAQRNRLAELKPKADFFDQVASSKTAISMRKVAAALNLPGWGRNKIFAFLRDQNILDASNLPYREYQDRGYFRVIEQKYVSPDGETHISLTTLVYQKGVDYIRRLVEKHSARVFA